MPGFVWGGGRLWASGRRVRAVGNACVVHGPRPVRRQALCLGTEVRMSYHHIIDRSGSMKVLILDRAGEFRSRKLLIESNILRRCGI